MPIFKKAVKIFFLLIAISLIIVTALCIFEAILVNKKFNEAWDEKLTNLEVDLSKPGSYMTDFQYSHTRSHGIKVFLQITPEDINEISIEELFETVYYDCITKQGDETITLNNAFPELITWPSQSGLIDLALVKFPYSQGRIQLNLTVNEGYPSLSGKKQRLVVKYLLCGCEKLPASIAIFIAVLSLVIAIIILLILMMTCEKKKPLDENTAP